LVVHEKCFKQKHVYKTCSHTPVFTRLYPSDNFPLQCQWSTETVESLNGEDGRFWVRHRNLQYLWWKPRLCCGTRRIIQCVRKVAVHLGYGTYIRMLVSKLPLKCAVEW